ncbi:endo-1,4-beta-xylanase [Obba rivulosa]|uniref:Beta-xylanase n=1 Tax=Obba rivulosa TaxID=1052685 RepID=A0A8E2ANY6_9APHY|nr:endo-1,4-beta-xylanase [Obba rivulosa]
MPTITSLFVLAALGAAVAASPLASASSSSAFPGSTAKVPGLNAVAKAAGKLYFGTATDNPELNDTAYTTILDNNRQFGQITPANSMKWDATEPSPGNFTFEGGDVIRDLAKGNGQILRGHNCVWYSQLPDWVAFGNFTFDELIAIVENHCGTLVGHYRGQISLSTTCSNRLVLTTPIVFTFARQMPGMLLMALNDDGTFREDIFFNVTGTAYIPAALRAAREADPHAKLYINDYNIEGTGNKSTALQNLIKELKKDGVPIDGVGFQCHFEVGGVPSTLVENFRAFEALGVEFAVTELDVRMTLPETDELLEQQKEDYQTVVEACLAVPACVGVTIWDFTDKYSWVPGAFPGWGAACPWDENLVKKPAYDGIVIGFEDH